MIKEDALEILECLKGQRTLFHYYQDKYAVFLLLQYFNNRDRVQINEVKNSVYGKLLQRPIIKQLLNGKGYLERQTLEFVWQPDFEPFVLTLGTWSHDKGYSGYQTSRPGCNLVLQVNLSKRWDDQFTKLFGSQANDIFSCGHPISNEKGATLGWIRLDLDFDSDEVLIEEIQSDLVKHLVRAKKRTEQALQNGRSRIYYYGAIDNLPEFLDGINQLLKPILDHWSEILMTCALWFCKEELGMEHVFYHSYETGNFVKRIRWGAPPRSLYTQLPKRFCFLEQEEGPAFLEKNRQASKRLRKCDSRWFKMAF